MIQKGDGKAKLSAIDKKYMQKTLTAIHRVIVRPENFRHNPHWERIESMLKKRYKGYKTIFCSRLTSVLYF